MRFYTNVQVHGGKILYRGYSDGKPIQSRVDYEPTLYIPASQKQETPFRSIKNIPLVPVEFKKIREAKDYIQQFGELTDIYGMRKFEYTWLDDNETGEYNPELVKVARIDIEVYSKDGFPEPEQALYEVLLIGMKMSGQTIVWGVGEYAPHEEGITYKRFDNEVELLKDFVTVWSKNYPDIVTGWNISGFDIPYLVNRIMRVLGEEWVKKLSPWGVIYPRKAEVRGYQSASFAILGIAILDSIELYIRYCPDGKSRDSYALDRIGEIEGLGKKIDLSEHGNKHTIWRTNFQIYTEYNVRDIELDESISDKYDMINLAMAIAYMNRVNYEDVFKQVRMWAAIVDNKLRNQGILLDHGVHHAKHFYSGAFVLEPEIRAYQDIVSFDLTSLYPHLIMQYNLSPETIIEPQNYTDEMRQFLSQPINVETLLHKKIDTTKLKEMQVTVSPNNHLFRTDVHGFLPAIMQEMYNGRDLNKKKQIVAEKLLEHEKDTSKHTEIKKEIAKYKSLQMALKVCLNSAYGAFGSEYFVLFDPRIAEAITSSGRLSIQWIGEHMNEYLCGILKTNKNYVIAQDTDSMYLWLHDLVLASYGNKQPKIDERIDFLDKIANGPLQDQINKQFNALKDYMNAYEQKMFMKREAIADRALWTGKKRYAMSVWDMEGVRYDKPHYKIVGLESVRSTIPMLARKAIEKLIEIILSPDQSQERAQKFVSDFKKEFLATSINEISVSSGVNGLEKYSDDNTIYKLGTPMHVKGALFYNHNVKLRGLEKEHDLIKEGNKIRFAPLRLPNPIQADVIAWENEFPNFLDLENYIDYNALFERAFLAAADRILGANKWTSKKVRTLDQFMM